MKTYFMLILQNQHQWVTSADTRLLVRQAWRQVLHKVIQTTTNQAAQNGIRVYGLETANYVHIHSTSVLFVDHV